ncbi:MAG TPA: hypothetical protein ENK85_01130 [Saprospiraceae bacterium]|nr:hypothetical protein [Saprospiraceae bacterium]
MHKNFIVLVFSLVSLTAFGQSGLPFTVELDSFTISNLEGVQSFAKAQSSNKWLIIGGRTNGVHPPQPPFAFETQYENKTIFVVEPTTQNVWKANLTNLPTPIQEQMSATNAEFYQNGDTLYIIGGYSYSPSLQLHITHPYVTAINVPGLMNAIINNQNISAFFKQGQSPQMAVTGGQLGKIGDTFYLVSGQKFTGLYNPNNGVSFSQAYTKSIRKFKLALQADTVAILNYEEIKDENSFRRRDYNLVPQIFPTGEYGYMLSSGVFQKDLNLPYLSPTDIRANTYQHRPGFKQYLSHYHSAKFGIYDATPKKMYSVFLGGMAQYYYQNNTLVQNDSVPFVKTISVVIRDSLDSLTEVALLDEMPGLIGSNAEIFYNDSLPFIHDHILDLTNIAGDTILVGHMFGGIESHELNPFFLSHNTASLASNKIYTIKLIRTIVGMQSPKVPEHPFDITLLSNPILDGTLLAKLSERLQSPLNIQVLSQDGKVFLQQRKTCDYNGILTIKLPNNLPSGIYFLTLSQEGVFARTKLFINK